MLKIGFWSNSAGNLVNHHKGLTPEQIEELKKLQVGDRLILWFNGKREGNMPTYNLKIDQSQQIKNDSN